MQNDSTFTKTRLQARFEARNKLSHRSFLNPSDFDQKLHQTIIDEGLRIKKTPKAYREKLRGKTVSLLFQKQSTRTRCSFETGIVELGGHPMYLDWNKTNFILANIEDEVRVLSRYCDLIVARMHKHADLELMDKYSEVPVCNGLTDAHHPCQIIADFATMAEFCGHIRGLKILYVGDGNNVCNSLMEMSELMAAKLTVVCPKAYSPDPSIIEKLRSVVISHDPQISYEGFDVIYTDTWVSMGQEAETEKRMADFRAYKITAKRFAKAKKDVVLMHCLPAHRGYEIDGLLLDSPNSVIYDQAENRKHIQKALLLELFRK